MLFFEQKNKNKKGFTQLYFSYRESRAGFTLVEMLVVLAIFAIITSLVLVKNSQFNNAVLLENIAYEVALSIREAQVSGLGVGEASPGSGDFGAGRGVVLDTNNPKRIRLFADTDGDKRFSGADVVIEDKTLTRGVEISQICGYITGSEENCTDTVVLYITYTRPDPDAHLERGNRDVWSSAEIHLMSPGGGEEIVVVRNTGQISVQN